MWETLGNQKGGGFFSTTSAYSDNSGLKLHPLGTRWDAGKRSDGPEERQPEELLDFGFSYTD